MPPSTAINANPVTIRSATGADLAGIESLLTSSDLPIAGVREALDEFLVAVASDRIVGVVGMEFRGCYGLLRSTAVAADWRGRGVARQLVEAIIARAESRGTHALYLLTTTAEQYFPSFGFRVTIRENVPPEIRDTTEYKGVCSASATVMCLPLRQ